jgi:hypothetical protein
MCGLLLEQYKNKSHSHGPLFFKNNTIIQSIPFTAVCPDHGSCHWMSKWMQDFCVMKLSCSGRRSKKKYTYSRAPVSADSVSAVSVIHGVPRPEKILKIKEINGS